VLFYQPRIYTDNGDIEGFEALIRWESQELGLVPPAQFIPIAEESTLICDIGKWVFETACKDIRNWVDAGYTDVCVSVNLSPKQIYHGDTLNVIKNAMKTHHINPRNLEIEITESSLLEDEAIAIEFLKQIRSIGVRLALDDFGTGYSSLSYLRKLPINILKIDRSFIIDVVDGKDRSSSVLETIITLAEKLSLETVAEGLETIEQLEILSNFGCCYIQGDYYSKPLSVDLANDYLAESTNRMRINERKKEDSVIFGT
jgi:EAL domain-containing protein (putative c-di-GMP-specific phosphodiesterase class I)